jgi:hypothetical protein
MANIPRDLELLDVRYPVLGWYDNLSTVADGRPATSSAVLREPFKNWVYLWGGTAAALFVSGYLAAIPIALRLKRREDGKKVPQPRSH